MGIRNWLVHGSWTSFTRETERPSQTVPYNRGMTSTVRPDRPRLRTNSERTLIASIITRLSIDVASVKMEHVLTDDNGMYVDTVRSELNECLTVKANIDQAGRFLRQDMASTLFSEGSMAVVPVETTENPLFSSSWDVKQLRVGIPINWSPYEVQVRVYNGRTGLQEDIWLQKTMVALVENPLYEVMNAPNSTLQRLIRKLAMLDHVDEISSSGKLDIIIQLPYVTRSETRQQQAKKRVNEIQDQLQGSTYGIAYTDGTEKITQLNRSVENNLLEQVKYLKQELYNELGLTEEIMNGTADDVTMLNYMNRTIEPVLDAITEAMVMKFLSKNARTRGQSIQYFQQPFKMIPISQLADVVDVLSRNQIVTPNEIRPALGLKPSKQPQADKLINSNMPLADQITGEGAETDPNALAEADLDRQMADLDLRV